MITKTSYFGTKRAIARATSPRASFSTGDAPFKTIGDRILEAQNYGADLGSTVPVTFDDVEDKTNGVDVMASPNKDFFEIAEEFGKMIESHSAPVQTEPTE